MIVYTRRWTQLFNKKITSLVCGILFIFLLSNFALADTSTASPEVSNFQVINTNTNPAYKGDMGLSLPLFTIPGRGGMGFPITLSYQAGIKTHQEASQVGLGWSLGAGTIMRGVNNFVDDSEYQGVSQKSIASYGCVDTNPNSGTYGWNDVCMSPEQAAGGCGVGVLTACLGGCSAAQLGGCISPEINGGKTVGCVQTDGDGDLDQTDDEVLSCKEPDAAACSAGSKRECVGSCHEGVKGGCTTNSLRGIEAKGSLYAKLTRSEDQEGGAQDRWFMNSPAGASEMMFDDFGNFVPLSYSKNQINYVTNSDNSVESFSIRGMDGSIYEFSEAGKSRTEGISWTGMEIEDTQYTFTNEEIAALEPTDSSLCGDRGCASEYTSGHSYDYYFNGQAPGTCSAGDHNCACQNAWICPYSYYDSSEDYLPCGDSYTQKLRSEYSGNDLPDSISEGGYCENDPDCYSKSSYQVRVFRCKDCSSAPAGLGGIDFIATGSEGCSSPAQFGMSGQHGDIAMLTPFKNEQYSQEIIDVWYLTEIKSHDWSDNGLVGLSDDDYGSWVKIDYMDYGEDIDETPEYYAQVVKETGLTDANDWFDYDVDIQIGGANDGNTFTFLETSAGLRENVKAVTRAQRKSERDLHHIEYIETPTSKADFVYSVQPGDEVQQLDEITLKFKSDVDEELITYNFEYAADNSGQQLKDPTGQGSGFGERTLLGVRKEGHDGSLEPSTQFRYYECNPRFDSKLYDDKGIYREYTDPWGLYTQIKDGDVYVVDDMVDGCGANAWSLSGVKYPTGGWVRYFYEPNSYRFVPNSASLNEDWIDYGAGTPKLGGGVRIKKVSLDDGINQSNTSYSYGAGVATRGPSETYNYASQERSYVFPWDYPGAGSDVYIAYSNITTMALEDGSYGKVVYDFKDPYEVKDDNWARCAAHDVNVNPYTGNVPCKSGYLTSNNWKRNYVEDTTYYDASNNPIRTTVNTVDTTDERKVWTMTNNYIDPVSGVSVISTNNPLVIYYRKSTFVKPLSVTDTMDGVTTTTTNTYHDDPSTGNGLIRSVEVNGPNGNLKAETYYAYESHQPGMAIKNMISQVYKTEAKNTSNPSIVKTQEIVEWDSFGGDWYPSATKSGVAGEQIITSTVLNYDQWGNVLQVQDAVGNINNIYYGNEGMCDNVGSDLKHAFLTCAESVIPGESNHQIKSYYDAKGRVDYISDVNNEKSYYNYDGLSRLESLERPVDETGVPGIVYHYRYAEDNGGISNTNLNEVEVIQRIGAAGRDSSSAEYFTSINAVDGVGKGKQSQVVFDDTYSIVQNTEFNEIFKIDSKTKPIMVESNRGKILKEMNPLERFFFKLGWTDEPDGWNHNYIYDLPGRSEDPIIKSEIDYDFDSLARADKVYPLGREQDTLYIDTNYGNDGAGSRTVEVIDEENKKVKSYSDVMGNLVKVVYDEGGSDERETTYEYDILGQVIEVRDEGINTVNEYDTLGRIEETCNPDSGCTSFTYYDNGNIFTKSDANGRIIKFFYDSLNRIDYVEVDSGSGQFVVRSNNTYDTGCISSSYQKGKLCKIERFNVGGLLESSIRYAYDEGGRVLQVENNDHLVGDTDNVYYLYDFADNIGWITFADDTDVQYTYNTLNQLEDITIWSWTGEDTLEGDAHYEYKETGVLGNITFGNNVRTDYEYTDRDWVESIVVGEDLFSESYNYYDSGNLMTINDNLHGEGAKFNYDNLYRLKEIYNIGTVPGIPSEYYDDLGISYTYDNKGNRQTRDVHGDPYNGIVWGETYNYDDPEVSGEDNRLMETTEDGCDYDYDSVGNVVKEECGSRIKTFRYDHNNLLTRAVLYSGRTMKFRYDPLGRRIWKEIMFPNGAYSRTFYRYGLGNNPLFEYKEEYTPDISSCFLAGTKVLMANNTEKNIEDVKVGEYVIGRDGKAEVYELESPIREDYYIVSFEDGNELRVTNEHPIYARNNKDEGWSSIIPEATWDDAKMDVSRLTEESEVLMIDGWMGIKEIKHVKEIIQTYNLKSVEGSTFYAGGVLVHNKNIPVRMMLDEPLDCPPNC